MCWPSVRSRRCRLRTVAVLLVSYMRAAKSSAGYGLPAGRCPSTATYGFSRCAVGAFEDHHDVRVLAFEELNIHPDAGLARS